MTTYDGRIVAGDRLIFFTFFSLSWQVMYTTCLLCFLLFNLSPHSINFLVSFLFIYRSFYSFQFNPSIVIFHLFGFSFRSLFFLISYFIPCSFVEAFFLSILSFNSFFWFFFFLLLKLFFNSTLPIENLYPSN